MEALKAQLDAWFSEPWLVALTIVVGSIVAAYLLSFAVQRTVGALARRTRSDLDDLVVAALRRPIFLSTIFYGLAWASDVLPTPARAHGLARGLLETMTIFVWAAAAFKIGHAVLEAFGRKARAGSLVQPRTVPVFDMVVKLTVIAVAVYFMFLAWNIDVTAWLASAGIIGIAVGFAAKDTLANLFAGIFILADAPYKLGDWIVLDDGLRGRVTRIGVRSTRVLTRDDVEITIPNAVIGASKIVNEAGGPHVRQRIGIQVEAAYGSDIDQVRAVLMSCARGPNISDAPEPEVRFRQFGGSGLVFQLMVYIEQPAARGSVIDHLNCSVYKAFAAAGIEIPYSKHDVYIKDMPRALQQP